MSGAQRVTKSQVLPHPIKGLNLVASPLQLQPTEARELENYYVFEHAIRQRAGATMLGEWAGHPIATLVPFVRMDSGGLGMEALMVFVQGHAYRFDAYDDITPTDVNGSVILNGNYTQWIQFNGYLFFSNSLDLITRYELAAGTTLGGAALTITGGSSELLYQPTVYNSRLYYTEYLSSRFWYASGPGVITGAMIAFDLAQVFQRGGTIAALTAWAYNQGVSSENLLVAVSSLGEVVVYSGDDPGAANWQLIGRTNIPRPVGTRSFITVGQDVYVVTQRGVIPLSEVFAGRLDAAYYSLSKKLGSSYGPTDVQIAHNLDIPFLYFVGASGQALYVLNYELGAWSKFVFPELSGTPITATAYAFGHLWLGTSNGQLWRMNDQLGGTASTSAYYKWKTPYMNFGVQETKRSTMARVIAKDVTGTSTVVSTTLSVNKNFHDAGDDPADRKAQAVTTTETVVLEHAAPQVGRWLSYNFTKQADAGQLNELNGVEIFYETGGVL